jgi:hypothetical protein
MIAAIILGVVAVVCAVVVICLAVDDDEVWR